MHARLAGAIQTWDAVAKVLPQIAAGPEYAATTCSNSSNSNKNNNSNKNRNQNQNNNNNNYYYYYYYYCCNNNNNNNNTTFWATTETLEASPVCEALQHLL